ncbi:MAG: ABC transporter substrate-binding protein, partial [Alphaproteobacteria bacterium]|nr:ABC transporter substrate-binding protein [Alphaproteobacteria bacterium]
MRSDGIRALSLATAIVVAALSAPAAKAQTPDPAVQQVQTFYDALLDSMKHAKELGLKGRYDKLNPVIEQTFDFPDMVKLAVGPGWATTSPAEQQALLTAFERMTVANYASNFNGYDGEKFVVAPTTTPRGTDRVVQSKLIAKDQTVPFGYRMRQSGGTWKILDIYLNGYVSQLATQRSDFGAT